MKQSESHKRLTGEGKLFLKFWAITIFATLVGYAVYIVLLKLGMHENIAYAINYWLGFILIFLLKWFTSPDVENSSFLPRLAKYALLTFVAMIVGDIVIYVWSTVFSLPPEWAFWVSCPFTFTVNTLGNRFYVFKDADDRAVNSANISEDKTDGGNQTQFEDNRTK